MRYVSRLLIALALLTSPIVHAEHANQTAIEAVEVWLSLLDAQEWISTWESAAPIFQSQVSAKEWGRMAKKARSPLGDFESRSLIGAIYKSELPGAPKGDYVVFQFQAKYSKQAEVIEAITPVLVDGVWRVSGYFVR